MVEDSVDVEQIRLDAEKTGINLEIYRKLFSVPKELCIKQESIENITNQPVNELVTHQSEHNVKHEPIENITNQPVKELITLKSEHNVKHEPIENITNNPIRELLTQQSEPLAIKSKTPDDEQQQGQQSQPQDENAILNRDVVKPLRRSLRQRKIKIFDYPSPKRRKPIVVPTDEVRINVVTDDKLIRERILTRVDVHKYHECTVRTELDDNILDLSKTSQRSQVATFVHESKCFLIMSWLTSVRLFEYDEQVNSYFEIRRIPQRYIALGPKIITSVHYDESKIYYSYLTDSLELSKTGHESCLEIRDINGNSLSEHHTYDYPIKSIQSDKDYIYLKTLKNIIYIHRKDFFHFFAYRVNLEQFTSQPIVSICASVELSKPMMSTFIFIATSQRLIITKYTALENKLWQCYNFEISYSTIAMLVRDRQLFIHRNSRHLSNLSDPKIQSKIEIGRIQKLKSKEFSGKYFIHESTICFNYSILQVELGPNDELYLFGYTEMGGTRIFELGIYDIKRSVPIWARRIRNVSTQSKILAQADHIVIIKDCQQYASIARNSSDNGTIKCPECGVQLSHDDIDSHDKHPGILRNLKTFTNKHLS